MTNIMKYDSFLFNSLIIDLSRFVRSWDRERERKRERERDMENNSVQLHLTR